MYFGRIGIRPMPFKGSIATAELDQMPLEVLADCLKTFTVTFAIFYRFWKNYNYRLLFQVFYSIRYNLNETGVVICCKLKLLREYERIMARQIVVGYILQWLWKYIYYVYKSNIVYLRQKKGKLERWPFCFTVNALQITWQNTSNSWSIYYCKVVPIKWVMGRL